MDEMPGLFDDAEVIYAYTRGQALEDGELVDVTELGKEAGLRGSVVVTRQVYGLAQERERKTGGIETEAGILWDVVWMASCCFRSVAAKKAKGSLVELPLSWPFAVKIGRPLYQMMAVLDGEGFTFGLPDDF